MGVVLKSRGFVVRKTWGSVLVQLYISLEDLGQVSGFSKPWFPLPHKIRRLGPRFKFRLNEGGLIEVMCVKH